MAVEEQECIGIIVAGRRRRRWNRQEEEGQEGRGGEAEVEVGGAKQERKG